MGFLSSLGGILGGSSKSSQSSASGYSALSPQLKTAFDKLGLGVEQYTNPNNPANLERFTPMAQTADETAALDAIRQGFTPTESSLRSDISMLMNPFDNFVIGDINRQAGGDYSILKQDIGAAGQLGSNRQRLGANDIEQTRLGTIGQLRQNQYNQALGQVFNNLVPQRLTDAQGLLGIGEFQRGLDTQTKQAPIAALQAGTSMLSPFISGGTSSGSSSTNAGILSSLGKLFSGIGMAG